MCVVLAEVKVHVHMSALCIGSCTAHNKCSAVDQGVLKFTTPVEQFDVDTALALCVSYRL